MITAAIYTLTNTSSFEVFGIYTLAKNKQMFWLCQRYISLYSLDKVKINPPFYLVKNDHMTFSIAPHTSILCIKFDIADLSSTMDLKQFTTIIHDHCIKTSTKESPQNDKSSHHV